MIAAESSMLRAEVHRSSRRVSLTTDMDLLDRRENLARMRNNAHHRQTSDFLMPTTGSRSSSVSSAELFALDLGLRTSPERSPSVSPPGSPSKPGPEESYKRKGARPIPLRPKSPTYQLSNLRKLSRSQITKFLLGVLVTALIVSLHFVKHKPDLSHPLGLLGRSKSAAAIDAFGPSPLLIWCIQTVQKLPTSGYLQSRTWIADARKHGVHVVFASEVDTQAGIWSIYNLPPSLELPQYPYKDIRLTTINGFRSLYQRHLGEKHRGIRWFMKADDDTYLRIPELLAAIERAEKSGMNPEDVHMIGYPWHDVDEAQWPKTYCWGGPGYLLSRGALQAFGRHSDACYDAMTYEDGIDHTEDQAAGLVPSITFTPDQQPRFGIEYEDMAISRCLDYFSATEYTGCSEFPDGNKTEFLSLWADNEVHQWQYLRDFNMTADLSVWTKTVEDPPRNWNFESAVSLHKVPYELMDLVHDVYCTSHGLHV